MTKTQKRDEKGRFTSNARKFEIEKIGSKKFMSGGHYEIVRGGQISPYKGDEIFVECRIFIPVTEDIEFGDRLTIAGEPLGLYWGSRNHGERCRTKQFVAKKWSDAFSAAYEWASAELQKLDDAILERRRALENAEI